MIVAVYLVAVMVLEPIFGRVRVERPQSDDDDKEHHPKPSHRISDEEASPENL